MRQTICLLFPKRYLQLYLHSTPHLQQCTLTDLSLHLILLLYTQQIIRKERKNPTHSQHTRQMAHSNNMSCDHNATHKTIAPFGHICFNITQNAQLDKGKKEYLIKTPLHSGKGIKPTNYNSETTNRTQKIFCASARDKYERRSCSTPGSLRPINA